MDDELLRRVADDVLGWQYGLGGHEFRLPDGSLVAVENLDEVITTDVILSALEEDHFPDEPVEVHLIRSWESETGDRIYVCRIYIGAGPTRERDFHIGDDPNERVLAAGRAALDAIEALEEAEDS